MTVPLARLLLFTASLFAASAQAAPPHRIVSLNLCADQYLIALADPGRIAALTRFARDPAMSFAAAKAAALPVSRGAAEDVLLLRPDLIFVGQGYRKETLAALGGRGIRIVELPPAASYAEIVAQVRQVAAAIGHPRRGAALIRRMDAQLAGVAAIPGRPVAAYYQRRGYLTGTGTLVDEMMKRVGLHNLAAVLDRPVLSRLSIEEMLAARPDYLVVENRRVVDRGTEMLQHPALARIPRLHLPEAWTVCGGPSYPFAVRRLAAQLRASRVSPSAPTPHAPAR